MRRHERRTIHVVSHGPSCLDGVRAAAIRKRFYAGERVRTTLAANGDSDRVIQGLRLKPGSQPDEIWVTDLSWTSTETAAHLRQLLRGGARAYWIDHHRTAVARADAPEFDVPFTGRLLSEQYSAAPPPFDFLNPLPHENGDPQGQPLSHFFPFLPPA